MRKASQRDIVANAHRKCRLLALRYDRHLERKRTGGYAARIFTVDLRVAALDLHAAEQCADDGALARSVRSGKRRYSTARTVKADTVDGVRSCTRVRNYQVMHCDHDVLRSCTRKNGTPSSAVIAPSGSSTGDARVRAARSAATTSVPPIRPAARISGRCARRPIARAISGTTSP